MLSITFLTFIAMNSHMRENMLNYLCQLQLFLHVFVICTKQRSEIDTLKDSRQKK